MEPENLTIPKRISDLIDKHIQESSSTHSSEWASMADVNKLTLTRCELYCCEKAGRRRICVPLCDRMFADMALSHNPNIVHGRFSVNLKLHIQFWILSAAKSWIDRDILPKKNDTKDSLAHRISGSKWCDEITYYYPGVPWDKQDDGYVGLTRHNNTTSSQPRRRSESVVVENIHQYMGSDGEGIGKDVITLFVYTSFGRHPDDWRGRPMRMSTFNLGLCVWRASWPYLTKISRLTPPTHCQILIYYALFHGAMGDHRDNSCTNDLKTMARGIELGDEGHPSAGADNSQIVGSNVLVYTIGNAPQTFTFKFANKKCFFGKRETYETTPLFQFECANGTVSVLDPIDDVLMTHSVKFEDSFLNDEIKKKNGYRIGWCFRWLQISKDFYTDTCGMRLDSGALNTIHNSMSRGNYAKADDAFPFDVKNIFT